MSTAWIIDGYNLILSLEPDPALAAGELARRRGILENSLVAFGKSEGVRPVVVYDGLRMAGGHPGGRRDEHLVVIFADPPAIADDLIFERAARHLREGRAVQVVTSDGGLAASVRKEGAQVTAVEAFAAALVKMVTPPAGQAPGTAAMPDIEAHFMAVHQEEERRAAAGGPPASVEVPAARPSSMPAAGLPGAGNPGKSVPAAPAAGPPAAGPPGEAERERRREKGRRRQQRRLQGRGDGQRQRRRH